MTIDPEELAQEIIEELMQALGRFPKIASPHEGLAIVQEEFDEFKAEVYKLNLTKQRDTRPQIRAELIQVAAMAMRTIMDTCPWAKEEVSNASH